MAYVTYDPNKPGDRERAYGHMLLGLVVIGGTVGSAFYYLFSVTSVLKGNGTGEFINALGSVIVMAIIDYFALFAGQKKGSKKTILKKYCTCFFGGIIDITAILSAIIAVLSLCHEGYGVVMLIISILVTLVTSLIWWYLYQRIEGNIVKLFSDKTSSCTKNSLNGISNSTMSDSQNNGQKQYFFCHKCGTKLLDDSIFCSTCGMKLKQRGEIMFCRFCGKQLQDDSDFCTYCGQRLNENNTEKCEQPSQNTQAFYEKDVISKDDSFYRQEVAKIASKTLVTVTKVVCYITLAVFLFLGVDMAPSYGVTQTMFYIPLAAIAILLVVLFNKKVLSGNRKALYQLSLVFSLFVLFSTVGLRLVYESKVDYVTSQMPSSGVVTLKMVSHTEFYNSTGTGMVSDPSTNIRIGTNWVESGDIIEINLDQKYDLRVGVSGRASGVVYVSFGDYVDSSIVFSPAYFSNGPYIVTKEVKIDSSAVDLAEVQMKFTRYCTFWEVILA